MSELALYRKYRPSVFDDVLGQDHIVKVLRGAIENKKISHAYLFFGPRGTGKTSIARIVAKELGTQDHDIYEIDAASNNKVEDIAELRENIRTLPFNSKYKIYILDEVHMLSKAAFNALLKTLEEPPGHVIFILATTEVEKVPETIVSRCQVFTFKKPTVAVLKELIMSIVEKEGFKIDNAGAEILAVLGDGSFRDTQSTLQKVMSFSKDKVLNLKEIEAVTGAPSGNTVNDFIYSISEGNLEKGLKAVRSSEEGGIDMEFFIKLVLMKLRLILLLRYAPEMKSDVENDIADSDKDFFKELTKDKNITSKTLEVLLDTEKQIKHAFVKSLPIEVALIKMMEK